MDIRKYWFSSSSRSQRSQNNQNIQLGRSSTKPHGHYRSYSPSSYDHGIKTVWQSLWRKLKRDKKKVFSSQAAATEEVEGIYDPETYNMNFDQGTGWMEPDNLPRSFSARYADPSRILPPKHLLG